MRQSVDNLVRILREREALATPHAASSTWVAIQPQQGTEAAAGVEMGGLGGVGGLELRRGVHEWAAGHFPVGFLAACCAASACKSVGCVVWIGLDPRSVGHALARLGRQTSPSLLERSIFIMPPDDGARLWAIDLALRSPGAAMVVADGSGLGVRETRRLQLAAEAGLREGGGGGGVALLGRRLEERAEPSAAMTRWLVQPAPTSGRRARWRLDLIKRKSSHPAISPECWFVEWDREKGAVVVPADVAGGFGAPARVEAERPDGPRLRHTA